jgi:hypothetical protein
VSGGLFLLETHGRYRLGAEELLELGRSRRPVTLSGRRPFLSGRAERGPFLGNREPELSQESVFILDMLGNVAGFIADGLAFALNTLGDLVDLPLNILSQGVDIVFNGVSGLLREVPIIGDVLAQILVMGGALVKFGLSIPGLVLHGLGNILAGIAKALKGSDADTDEKVDTAKKDIVNKAPDPLKDNVKKILDASGVTGSNLTPSVSPTGQPLPTPPGSTPPGAEAPGSSAGDLTTALAIGVPVVGVLALVAALS